MKDLSQRQKYHHLIDAEAFRGAIREIAFQSSLVSTTKSTTEGLCEKLARQYSLVWRIDICQSIRGR